MWITTSFLNAISTALIIKTVLMFVSLVWNTAIDPAATGIKVDLLLYLIVAMVYLLLLVRLMERVWVLKERYGLISIDGDRTSVAIIIGVIFPLVYASANVYLIEYRQWYIIFNYVVVPILAVLELVNYGILKRLIINEGKRWYWP